MAYDKGLTELVKNTNFFSSDERGSREKLGIEEEEQRGRNEKKNRISAGKESMLLELKKYSKVNYLPQNE